MTKASSVLPRDKPCTGRTAIGSGDVTLGEADSSFGDPIDMGRGDFGITLTTEFPIAQVIGQEDNQVGHFRNWL